MGNNNCYIRYRCHNSIYRPACCVQSINFLIYIAFFKLTLYICNGFERLALDEPPSEQFIPARFIFYITYQKALLWLSNGLI